MKYNYYYAEKLNIIKFRKYNLYNKKTYIICSKIKKTNIK